jgi:hypothetical protein
MITVSCKPANQSASVTNVGFIEITEVLFFFHITCNIYCSSVHFRIENIGTVPDLILGPYWHRWNIWWTKSFETYFSLPLQLVSVTNCHYSNVLYSSPSCLFTKCQFTWFDFTAVIFIFVFFNATRTTIIKFILWQPYIY